MSNNQNVDSIFLAALEMPSERQRAAYLRDACGADATIRARVEQLLEAHVDAGEFMRDDKAIAATIEAPLSEKVGDRIGPFKLLQEIGEGGFGVVYMAEQMEPVRRKVALKIIKPGMDTKEVIARFEAERQALALMDHPNIAKVHDGGATETGRPYFVMELVKGVSITEYCDKNNLSTEKRLELFVTVCRAVQHAHQKGIIHRDLKPSNVMVTLHDGEPVPKVIDFGVAKATSQQLTERTLFTAYGQMIGTPLYMSPEQAEMNGLDVDTRSDVYSLGVLLYELLAGTTPFDGKRLREAGYVEMQRIIREEAPPSPSMRLSTLGEEATIVSGHRSTDCGRLRQLLRGDLDVIVMKTLEKNRDQRYESASSLADDLERYLRQEAILARPPSPVYRLRKYVQRNRSRLRVGTVVLTAFVVCVAFGWIAIRYSISSGVFEVQARQAKKDGEQQRLESRRMQKAREVDLPRLEQLVEQGRLVPAFRLARELREVIPDDPALAKLWEELTIEVTFNIDPDGTRIFVRDWDASEDDWLEIGRAPLTARVPDGNLRWRYMCEGYETREQQWQHSGTAYNWLWPNDRPVRHMVRIPKRTMGKPNAEVFIPTFLIDRHEVTNGEFQRFVDEGGYDRTEFWDQEFFDEQGEPLSREKAMNHFRDTTTGSAGPAVWKNGRFPDGEEDSPVRGVSWYEAMAYAKFAGKSLPTVHHWRWAGMGSAKHMVRFSNYSAEGPAEVEVNRGIGIWGVYDMAGNVKEWCSNRYGANERTLRGADWNGPEYLFTSNDHAPPINRGETMGFRCVKYVNPPTQESLAGVAPKGRSTVPSATAEQIKNYKELVFAYDRDLPWNEEQIASDKGSDADYRHDVWRIDAAYGTEQRFDIHFFMPREGRAPFETVVWFTGVDALRTNDFEDHTLNSPVFELERRLVRTGRMVVVPIFQGTYERTLNARGRRNGKRRQEWFAEMVKDLSRTIDFLEGRPEVDSDRLIYAGLSFGAGLAPMNLTIEPRFRAALLIAAGYDDFSGYENGTDAPTINQQSYMKHVQTPTLVLNGLYDTVFPVDDSQLPFFDDLGSPDKHLEHYESGHVPPADEAIRFADQWLKSRLSSEPGQ